MLALRTYYFITEKSVSKEMKNIKDITANFGVFQEEVGMSEIICTKIQTIISFWKECLENRIKS